MFIIPDFGSVENFTTEDPIRKFSSNGAGIAVIFSLSSALQNKYNKKKWICQEKNLRADCRFIKNM